MGHSAIQRKITKTIPKWGCLGRWGYGHGRSVKEHGEKWFKELSVCQDLCPQSKQCQQRHHLRMDQKYPEIADLVHRTARYASRMKAPVVHSVMGAMNVAISQGLPGAEEIMAILTEFKVNEMTDHYVCGQFQNIQSGLDGEAPDFERPIPLCPEVLCTVPAEVLDGEAG